MRKQEDVLFHHFSYIKISTTNILMSILDNILLAQEQPYVYYLQGDS